MLCTSTTVCMCPSPININIIKRMRQETGNREQTGNKQQSISVRFELSRMEWKKKGENEYRIQHVCKEEENKPRKSDEGRARNY